MSLARSRITDREKRIRVMLLDAAMSRGVTSKELRAHVNLIAEAGLDAKRFYEEARKDAKELRGVEVLPWHDLM